jgi:putative ABC transport system ATP-binding protein
VTEIAGNAAGVDGRRPIVELDGVSRVYRTGEVEVSALRDVDLTIVEGEFVAIVGPSGSGKSTLMHIIGCLDRPTRGSYRLSGQPTDQLDDDDLAAVRSRRIGFVFQTYNLLPRTSAIENVTAPLLYQGVRRAERTMRAQAALERLGLGARLSHEPTQLSGGEQQRVALARAIVTRPELVLADEPTGNLDSHAGGEVLAVLHELHEAGHTIALITHDPAIAARATRQVHLLDGQVVP